MSVAALYLGAAEEDDVTALVALERECYTHPWTVQNFREGMHDSAGGRILVLRAPFAPEDPERGILAYCALQVVVDDLHILNLAVRPRARRRGLARRLLGIVLDIGARRGVQTAWLEVRQSNWEALELYRSVGFETVSVRRDYYGSPREDALVLRNRDVGRPPASLAPE